MKVSKRAESVPPSATIAVTARAQQLKSQGIDVVGFGAGAPDFDTPDYIKQAAVKALEEGKTKYTPSPGIPELRSSIARKLQEQNGLDYKPEQVIVTIGGKHAVYELMQAAIDPGDEVILPAPYWVTYPEAIKLAGGVPRVIRTERANSYKLTPEQLKEAMTGKTAMLFINSPNNPGGFTYTPQELKEIARVLEGTKVMVLSDEIYEKLIYGDTRFVSFASLSEDAYGRTITLNGFSKAFSMTGWRIGYAAGPIEVIKAMSRLQSHMTSNAVTFGQYAAIRALGEGSGEAIEQMRAQFEKRGTYMSERLNKIDGVESPEPTGAFYCFPDVSSHYGRNIGGTVINSSSDFAKALLEQQHVALVPGAAFGLDENVRMSFACSMEQIKEGIDRLEKWLSQ